jgi:hypothetical protein
MPQEFVESIVDQGSAGADARELPALVNQCIVQDHVCSSHPDHLLSIHKLSHYSVYGNRFLPKACPPKKIRFMWVMLENSSAIAPQSAQRETRGHRDLCSYHEDHEELEEKF